MASLSPLVSRTSVAFRGASTLEMSYNLETLGPYSICPNTSKNGGWGPNTFLRSSSLLVLMDPNHLEWSNSLAETNRLGNLNLLVQAPW